MKVKIFLVLTFSILLMIVIGLGSCHVHIDTDTDRDRDRGNVVITNNSNKSFKGKVWTDSYEIFNGTIRAWHTKSFCVSDGCTVYTDFESDNGGKSNPSGRVSRHRTLVLDL